MNYPDVVTISRDVALDQLGSMQELSASEFCTLEIYTGQHNDWGRIYMILGPIGDAVILPIESR
jgi:hypothetical protein